MSFSDKWNLLEAKRNSSGLNTIRVAEECALEIFLATDEERSHIVLIHLPQGCTSSVNVLKNDNIELRFLKESNCIFIKLTNSDFSELFDDLITSLIESTEGIENNTIASKVFVETYIKWNAFFETTFERKLGKDRVIGLWGELSYLAELINDKDSGLSVNNILRSWGGPYGAVHDFEFLRKSIEVKTKLQSANTIKVSSEFQLESLEEKGLELVVLSIVESESGNSIEDLFLMIKRLVKNKGGDLTLLLTALREENLDEQRLSKYSSLRFIRKKSEFFDCCLKGFPKIIESEVPRAISSVKYDLDTRQLAEFKISQEVY